MAALPALPSPSKGVGPDPVTQVSSALGSANQNTTILDIMLVKFFKFILIIHPSKDLKCYDLSAFQIDFLYWRRKLWET